MKKGTFMPEESEKGFVFIVCILLLFVLTIAGVATVRTSGTEVWTVRNQGQVIREFYNAESGLIDAFENPDWLLDDSLFTDTVTAAASGPWTTTLDGQQVASYRVRCIAMGTLAPGLWDFETQVPKIDHQAAPPVGSGDSAVRFVARRFAITAKSHTGNTRVQSGVWKSFPKNIDE
jgi:hypothetical protein